MKYNTACIARYSVMLFCIIMLSTIFITPTKVASAYGRRNYVLYVNSDSYAAEVREFAREHGPSGSVRHANKNPVPKKSLDVRRGANSPAVMRDGGLVGDRTAAGDAVVERARLSGQYQMYKPSEL